MKKKIDFQKRIGLLGLEDNDALFYNYFYKHRFLYFLMVKTRKYFIQKGSIYILDKEGNLTKGKHVLGRGFYIPISFLNEYINELRKGCFRNYEQKQEFIASASINEYKDINGRLAFFNPKNHLRLELSSKVIKTEPEFDLEDSDLENKAGSD